MRKPTCLQFAFRKKPWFFFFVLTLFVASCSDDESDPGFTKLTSDYCNNTDLDCSLYMPPFHVGDYWIADDGGKTEITATSVIDGKTYFVLSWFEAPDAQGNYGTPADTWYERLEGSKHFFRSDADSEEELMADFSVDVDDDWETPYFDGGTTTVKLESKTEEITINGITFADAYVFGRTYSDYPAAYIPITYLPGIGLVAQQNFQNGVLQVNGTWKVVEFRLDGKVYKIE